MLIQQGVITKSSKDAYCCNYIWLKPLRLSINRFISSRTKKELASKNANREIYFVSSLLFPDIKVSQKLATQHEKARLPTWYNHKGLIKRF
jgi:hypothetical protein